MPNSAGKTTRPTIVSTQSASTMATSAAASIATTPTAIGSGMNTAHAASTSALALESSCPVGWRWCHDMGSARYWRVTLRR